MSVRAYKIKKVLTEKEPTFNCWHDEFIMERAELDHYNGDDGGYLTFYAENFADMDRGQLTKEQLKVVDQILRDMGDEDYVEYLCY